MPSILVGTPGSGAYPIFGSGNINSGINFPITSGRNPWPVGGVTFRHDPLGNSGGIIFIGLSGAVTQNSGGFMLSGGLLSGMLDGMPLAPGDSYFVPKSAIPISGVFNVFASPNAQASGQRLYFEIF